MKAYLIGGFTLLMLAGCTSTGGYQTAAKSEVDWDKMHSVERAANTVNTKVYWINPPRKKVAEDNHDGQENGS